MGGGQVLLACLRARREVCFGFFFFSSQLQETGFGLRMDFVCLFVCLFLLGFVVVLFFVVLRWFVLRTRTEETTYRLKLGIT